MAELTEEEKKELKRRNDVAKTLFETFIKKGIWSLDDPLSCGDIETFSHYLPETQVKLSKYDDEKKDYTSETYTVPGAEYRYNLMLMRGYGNYEKLDPEQQKLVNNEIFGQETRPLKSSQEYVDGINKCKKVQRIVNAEYNARPLAPSENSKDAPSNGKPMDSSTPKQIGPMRKDGTTSMILNEETFYAMFDVPEAPKPTKTLAEFGLPESIRGVLDASNFKAPDVISTDAPATRLAFKAAKTEGTKKTPQVA